MIVPSSKPHAVGLVELMDRMSGVTGSGSITTSIDTGEDEQPAIVKNTDIVYVPGAVAVIVVVSVVDKTKPASGDDALQVNVAPETGSTPKLTVLPKQTGFGSAKSPVGAAGAFGSDNVIGPGKTPEVQPDELV